MKWAAETEEKRLKRGIRAAAVGMLLAMGTVAATNVAANAVEGESDPGRVTLEGSPEQLAAIKAATFFLTSHGVEPATQAVLFAKFLAGERWDSFSSASTPVNVEHSIEGGYDKTVSYYPDGSVAVSRIERPSAPQTGNDSSIMSEPNGCTVGSGGSRTNCNVDTWVGLISMGFKANYNVSTNTVSSVWGASWSIGGSCSSSLAYLGRPNSYTGLMTVSAQMCGVPYATSFNLAVTLSGGAATESWW